MMAFPSNFGIFGEGLTNQLPLVCVYVCASVCVCVCVKWRLAHVHQFCSLGQDQSAMA